MSTVANVIQNNTQNALLVEKEKAKRENFSYLYIMFYRHGMNANLTKGFYFPGNLLEARARAEEHCRIMGYKFIFIRPMVCDLAQEEEYRLRGAKEGELIP